MSISPEKKAALAGGRPDRGTGRQFPGGGGGGVVETGGGALLVVVEDGVVWTGGRVVGAGLVAPVALGAVVLGTGSGAGAAGIGTGTIFGAATTGGGAGAALSAGALSRRCAFGVTACRRCVVVEPAAGVSAGAAGAASEGAAAFALVVGAGSVADAGGVAGASSGGGVMAAFAASGAADVCVVVLATFGCRAECATASAITTPTTTTIPRKISIRVFRALSA